MKYKRGNVIKLRDGTIGIIVSYTKDTTIIAALDGNSVSDIRKIPSNQITECDSDDLKKYNNINIT